MILDEDLIKEGITPRILERLITKHEYGRGRYQNLREYYIGHHAIMSRTKQSRDAANNKIVCNHAKYITDMTQSYLVGNPIDYAASEDYDIEEIKNAYLEQDISSLDSELVKHMSIYGCAYELIYSDEQSRPRSVKLSPENTFVVYAQSAAEKPLFAVYYYKKYDLEGVCKGTVVRVYDRAAVYEYAGSDGYMNLTLRSETPHYFCDVPIIEYRNNDEKQGDFEQLISLIDAYNTLQSDRVNDKEQFVDSILFLTGIDIDSDQAKKLREERILMGYDGADARYLSKVLNEADTKVLRDDLKDDIHRLSYIPDLSEETFSGNLSGVAIRYKLIGFENHIKNKERNFTCGLRKRFEIYNHFLMTLSKMAEVPVHRVDIVLNRNLPANELEIAQMINYLNGLVSSETLLGQLPFVSDAHEEAELAKKEKAENMQREMSAMDYRDYGKLIREE